MPYNCWENRLQCNHTLTNLKFPFDPCLPFLAHLSQPLPIAQAPKEWFLANQLKRPEFQFMACAATSRANLLQGSMGHFISYHILKRKACTTCRNHKYHLHIIIAHVAMFDQSFEVKLPTYGQMQQEWWEQSEKRRIRRERDRRERGSRQKIKVREKVEKLRSTVFFQCVVALEGRKVGSLKRRVGSHEVRLDMKNCAPFVAGSRF